MSGQYAKCLAVIKKPNEWSHCTLTHYGYKLTEQTESSYMVAIDKNEMSNVGCDKQDKDKDWLFIALCRTQDLGQALTND